MRFFTQSGPEAAIRPFVWGRIVSPFSLATSPQRARLSIGLSLGEFSCSAVSFIGLIGGVGALCQSIAIGAKVGADRLSWRRHPNCNPESPRGVAARTSGPWLRRRAKLRVGGSLRRGAARAVARVSRRTGPARGGYHSGHDQRFSKGGEGCRVDDVVRARLKRLSQASSDTTEVDLTRKKLAQRRGVGDVSVWHLVRLVSLNFCLSAFYLNLQRSVVLLQY